jgi:DNA-binding SARP family transcriptional activator/TolB-like protein/tetratricopeptide (TPR) repeat protein
MLHLKTFGGLSVEIDGIPGTGAAQQRKTLALLALLAVAGPRGLSRDKLIACLWPETDAERGRGLLNQACYALRRDLHARDLFLGSIQLRLNPDVISSDVASFASALEQNDPAGAVACYAAPFLDGFYLNGGGEFETWAATERAQLADQLKGALQALSEAATLRGEHRVAATWWRRLLDLDPLSSHAVLGLMTSLDQAGERAEALRVGQVHGELVRTELGSAPPPELAEWTERHRYVAGNGVKKTERAEKTDRAEKVEEGNTPAAEAQHMPVGLTRRVQRAQILSLTALAAVLLLLAGAGYAVWKQQGSIGAAEPLAPGRKMLAVLPFENRGQAADDYFADGLTEAIGLRLGGVRSLGVIASQSASRYKGTSKSLTQIGRELGVQYILRGSVWWDRAASSGRVRVSPVLYRVSDGRQLWAAAYDTVLTGMFALQTSLATKVAGALDVTLLTDERVQLEAPTSNPEAYEAFLRGLEAARAPSPATRRGSADLFQRAVALDPSFVSAWAYLSITHVILYLSYLDRNVERLTQGKAAMDRATQLDPHCNSGSCCARGFYQLFVLKDYDGALQSFARARKVRPSDSGLLGLIAHVYRRRGEWDKALAYEREAERLNPLDEDEAASLADNYAALRQFPAANYYWDRALTARPQAVGFRLTKAVAYLNLTGDLAGAQRILPDVSENPAPTGNHDVVITLSDIALLLSQQQQTQLLRLAPAALDGDTAALALAKALVYRRRNQPALARASFDSARAVLGEKVRRSPNGDPFYHAMLGLALAGSEHPDEAVREGERAVELLPYPGGGAESALMPANLARIHVLLGNREKAIDQLIIVFSRPGPLSPAWLRVDPFWDSLRGNPRFQRLAAARN